MKSDAVLIELERVIEDGAQRNPPAQRGDAGAERMRARGHMREVTAGLGTRRVNRTQVPVQEDAAVFLAFENASRRSLRIRVRRVPNYLFTIHVEVSGQGLDLGLADGNHRMTAAIRAGGAIDLALDSYGEGLKLLDSTVVGRQITPELEVFGLLDVSKPADLDQIGYHALRILPRPTEGKRPPIGSARKSAGAAFPQILPDRKYSPVGDSLAHSRVCRRSVQFELAQ